MFGTGCLLTSSGFLRIWQQPPLLVVLVHGVCCSRFFPPPICACFEGLINAEPGGVSLVRDLMEKSPPLTPSPAHGYPLGYGEKCFIHCLSFDVARGLSPAVPSTNHTWCFVPQHSGLSCGTIMNDRYVSWLTQKIERARRPPFVKIARARLQRDFAVLLMRSSYQVRDAVCLMA